MPNVGSARQSHGGVAIRSALPIAVSMEMQGLKQAAMRPSEAFGTTKEFIWKQPEKPKPL